MHLVHIRQIPFVLCSKGPVCQDCTNSTKRSLTYVDTLISLVVLMCCQRGWLRKTIWACVRWNWWISWTRLVVGPGRRFWSFFAVSHLKMIPFNKPPVKCGLSTALRGTCWQMPRIYVQPWCNLFLTPQTNKILGMNWLYRNFACILLVCSLFELSTRDVTGRWSPAMPATLVAWATSGSAGWVRVWASVSVCFPNLLSAYTCMLSICIRSKLHASIDDRYIYIYIHNRI